MMDSFTTDLQRLIATLTTITSTKLKTLSWCSTESTDTTSVRLALPISLLLTATAILNFPNATGSPTAVSTPQVYTPTDAAPTDRARN